MVWMGWGEGGGEVLAGGRVGMSGESATNSMISLVPNELKLNFGDDDYFDSENGITRRKT